MRGRFYFCSLGGSALGFGLNLRCTGGGGVLSNTRKPALKSSSDIRPSSSTGGGGGLGMSNQNGVSKPSCNITQYQVKTFTCLHPARVPAPRKLVDIRLQVF